MADDTRGSARASKHVLVVNDTEEIIELFRDILEGMGHHITAITYAPEDLEEVRRIKPDLAILDFLVGGESHGWQLVQKMRMAPETAGIPIIVCTAAVSSVREQEGWLMSQGIKVVLKPFNVQDLEIAVDKAIALPDMLEA